MVVLLSLLLCTLLCAGILFVIFPDLFPSFIVKRWEQHFHYFR
jgi:hypothetical protein